jgi:hypothetical protein
VTARSPWPVGVGATRAPTAVVRAPPCGYRSEPPGQRPARPRGHRPGGGGRDRRGCALPSRSPDPLALRPLTVMQSAVGQLTLSGDARLGRARPRSRLCTGTPLGWRRPASVRKVHDGWARGALPTDAHTPGSRRHGRPGSRAATAPTAVPAAERGNGVRARGRLRRAGDGRDRAERGDVRRVAPRTGRAAPGGIGGHRLSRPALRPTRRGARKRAGRTTVRAATRRLAAAPAVLRDGAAGLRPRPGYRSRSPWPSAPGAPQAGALNDSGIVGNC